MTGFSCEKLRSHIRRLEVITRSRSVSIAFSSRGDLERLSAALLENEMPLRKPVRLLGISLSSLQDEDESDASQLAFSLWMSCPTIAWSSSIYRDENRQAIDGTQPEYLAVVRGLVSSRAKRLPGPDEG